MHRQVVHRCLRRGWWMPINFDANLFRELWVPFYIQFRFVAKFSTLYTVCASSSDLIRFRTNGISFGMQECAWRIMAKCECIQNRIRWCLCQLRKIKNKKITSTTNAKKKEKREPNILKATIRVRLQQFLFCFSCVFVFVTLAASNYIFINVRHVGLSDFSHLFILYRSWAPCGVYARCTQCEKTSRRGNNYKYWFKEYFGGGYFILNVSATDIYEWNDKN